MVTPDEQPRAVAGQHVQLAGPVVVSRGVALRAGNLVRRRGQLRVDERLFKVRILLSTELFHHRFDLPTQRVPGQRTGGDAFLQQLGVFPDELGDEGGPFQRGHGSYLLEPRSFGL